MTKEKIDLKKKWKSFYSSPKKPTLVEVPAFNYIMVDGRGNPNTSKDYIQAIEILYGMSYTLKFMLKPVEELPDYSVMPLEGLWWMEDIKGFDADRKDDWYWTAMIHQPEFIEQKHFDEAKDQLSKKKDLPLDKARFESFEEGFAAQILHIGPYDQEAENIAKIHQFIQDQNGELTGKHHEIYLSDPRRTAPERLKTIVRQPYRLLSD